MTAGPPMTHDQADAALGRAGAFCDRMAERLVGLDGHQGQRLLDNATLTPDSGLRWARARERIAALWADFDAYRTVLTQARELRGRRDRLSDADLAELTALLRGTDLAGLERRMEDDHAAVLPVVTAAVDGWSALAQRLDPLTERLAGAAATAADLGVADDTELATVRAELGALRSSDPLALPADLDQRLRGAEVRLHRTIEQLSTLRKLHENYPRLRAELADRVDRLDAVHADTAALHVTVAAKIASAGPAPAAGRAVERLRGFLAELDGLHTRQEWARLARRYGEVDEQSTDALAAATVTMVGLRELLDRRAELRGRLDAYRAKAGRLGHAEDITLQGLHRAAHELLFVAPCDLAAATRAVAAFQQAVNASTHKG